MARLMVAIANKSSRDTSRRVKEGMERRARSGGYFHGGGRPFGWEPDGITPRPVEGAIITDLSTRVIELDDDTGKPQYSLRYLCRELNEGGVPTVTGVPWTVQSLRYMLLRPRNAGLVAHKGEEVGKLPGEPLVKEEVYRAVVRLLTDPARRTGPGRTPKWLGSNLWLCGRCDSGTAICNVGKSTSGGRIYQCREFRHVTRDLVTVDRFVKATLLNRVGKDGFVERFVQSVISAPEVDAAALRLEMNAIRGNLNGLAEDRALGLIDRAQMLSATERGNRRLTEISELLAASTSSSPLAPFVGCEDAEAVWDAQPLASKRAISSALFTVTILPTGRRGKIFDPKSVRISWTESARIAAA